MGNITSSPPKKFVMPWIARSKVTNFICSSNRVLAKIHIPFIEHLASNILFLVIGILINYVIFRTKQCNNFNLMLRKSAEMTPWYVTINSKIYLTRCRNIKHINPLNGRRHYWNTISMSNLYKWRPFTIWIAQSHATPSTQ